MSRRRDRIPGKPRNTLFMLPAIPDDAPTEIKNALAIRNAANVHGRCPSCGATPNLYAHPDHPLIFQAVFEHESGCGAFTDGETA